MKKKGVFALLCLGHFHVDFMWGIWTILKTMLNIDLAVAGMVVGACTFTAEMMQLFWGSLSDRGYRFLILGLGLVLANAFAFLPYVPENIFALLLFFPIAMGSSAFHPAAAGIVGQYNPQRRGFNMAFFWSWGAIGLSVSQIAFSYLFTHYHHVFVLTALPGIALSLWSLYYFRRDDSLVSKDPLSLIGVFGFFQRKDTLCLWLAQVFLSSIYWGTLFLLPDILMDKGYPIWISTGGAHMVYVLGAACTSLLAGWAADRISPKWVLFASSLIGGLSFFTMVLNDAMLPAALLGCCFLTGAMLGQSGPLTLALGNALAPHQPALISAFLMGFVWFISEAIGTTGLGLITKAFDSHQPTNALICLGFLFVPALLSLWIMPLKVKGLSSQTSS